jgi:putative oxidoreductase
MGLIVPHCLGVMLGILLLFGLWTPIAGMLIGVLQIWVAISHAGDPWSALAIGSFGATLAMIGPGAWSIDARLFGRKHIQVPTR